MQKKLIFFVFLILSLCFGISAAADEREVSVLLNGTRLNTSAGFAVSSDTLYISPQMAADVFSLTLSVDEGGGIYTFSNSLRLVTYDSYNGSVNISDGRSFSYSVIENAYPSYRDGNVLYVPIRMLCSSIGIGVDYIYSTNTVSLTLNDYYTGLYNSEGIAIAKKGLSYGMVNAAGDVLLPFIYDDISNYDNEHIFKVISNHKCAIANSKGQLVTDIIYNEIEYVSAGEIYIHIDAFKGMCDITGKVLIPAKYDDIAYSGNNIAMVKKGSKWSLLNFTANKIGDAMYDEIYEITAGIQTDNHMIKGYYALKDGKWGCIDSFGETVIDFIYDGLDKFDGLGRARIISDGKMGIIDCGGQMIISPVYDYIHPFGRLKVAVAEIDGKYGAVKLDGSVAVDFKYDYIYSFNDSLSTVAYKDGEFFVISTDGSLVTDKTYKYIEEFKGGIALAYSDGYGYIDHSGNEIIDCVHTDVKQGTALSVFLKKDGKWALFSPLGENLSGFIYDDAGIFENGLSAVSKLVDGTLKYGYVNDSGDEIIPFIYSSALSFKYGKAIVALNNTYGIVDIEGNVVIPFEYTGFNPSYDYNVIAAADIGSKWGLISFTNEKLTPFFYDYIYEFENGYAAVLLNHKYGVINTKGEIVVAIEHKTVEKALEAVNNIDFMLN